MADESDGNDHGTGTAEEGKPNGRHPTILIEQVLDSQIAPFIGMTVRGIFATAAAFPADAVACSIARTVGAMLGSSLHGSDFGQVLKLRGSMKQAFLDGMNATKPADQVVGKPAAGVAKPQ